MGQLASVQEFKINPVRMDTKDTSGSCAFDKLFTRNVPHILEKIFLFLDYESFKSCLMVNKTWNKLLMSDSFQKKAESTFDEWLFCAAYDGHTAVVQHLIYMGTKPDKDDVHGSGWTALHIAAHLGHEDVVKVLLDAGANPNLTDNIGQAPISYAVKDGHRDVVKILLDGGADPNILSCFFNGLPPLHLAVGLGYRDTAKLLLDRGADPAKVNVYGWNPLRVAEALKREDMVKLLQEY